MSALVLKAWKVNNRPVDADDNYVLISGRRSGLVSWFLSLVGVDPTTTIKIGIKRIEFQESSLSGTNNRMIPLRGVCSTYFGYHKPWKQALAIFVFLMVLSISLSSMLMEMGSAGTGAAIFMVGTLIGLIVGFIYYFLNRTLTLGFVENSGVISGIRFKRSVIENIDVNETQACFVCELTQELIEQKIK